MDEFALFFPCCMCVFCVLCLVCLVDVRVCNNFFRVNEYEFECVSFKSNYNRRKVKKLLSTHLVQ